MVGTTHTHTHTHARATFIKGRFEFSKFSNKAGFDFFYKKGGFGKIGGLFLKRGYHLFSYKNRVLLVLYVTTL